MAWIDDRIWCHPKIVILSDKAFRVYVNSLTYSSGLELRGHLINEQQQQIGVTPKVRQELLAAGLWDPNGNGIVIHDWDEHNSKRDDRKERERERKRRARQEGRWK